jgi:ABC-type bacteriocin/lantibiotic exporter with double-glycine peptidase domain
LTAQYRAFKGIEDLRRAGLTIAVVKFNLMLDHCVTVLGVEDSHVLVGDPLTGLATLSAQEFESKWQFVGVVLKRTPPGRELK